MQIIGVQVCAFPSHEHPTLGIRPPPWQLLAELDRELVKSGIRGQADPGRDTARRHRSTRRRQDTPDLPLRKGELLGLRWCDIDFGNATLTICQALQRVGGRLVLVDPKTALSRRVVPVPMPTLAALRAHRTRQRADRLAAGSAWRDTGLVFTTHRGGPLEPRNVNRSWYAVRSRAGLDATRLHDLRHSCASFLLAAGASPRTEMKTLGHSQIGLTMNTYTHVLPEIERAAIDAAAKAIFE
jgi:integrase